MNGSSMLIPVTLEGLNNLKGCSVTGLIDSGATGGFINKSVVEEQGMEREALPIPVLVYNADGMLNKGGLITHVARL
jgi:predicted aspartyl protease